MLSSIVKFIKCYLIEILIFKETLKYKKKELHNKKLIPMINFYSAEKLKQLIIF